MYLIQSRKEDFSTYDVLDWLRFLDAGENSVCRLNNSPTIESISYRIGDRDQENFMLKTDQGTFNSNDIDGYWYRRGMLGFPNTVNRDASSPFCSLFKEILSNSYKEESKLVDSLYHFLHRRKNGGLNTFHENFTNKVTNLSEARKVGLKVPDTLITNDVTALLRFADEHGTIITKDIEFDDISVPYNNEYAIHIRTTVQLLSKEEVLALATKYKSKLVSRYAMFQQYIPKRYELRCFYLKGKIYTMAIFSQANEQTKIDFRNYDQQRPNRCVPYQLPAAVEDRLKIFMTNIRMNCGSIDIIFSPDKEYIFLEVNPIGQFQWLSRNCNYDIERQIAKQLINK